MTFDELTYQGRLQRAAVPLLLALLFLLIALVVLVDPAHAQGPFPNCRLGVGGAYSPYVGDYNIGQLNMGLYLDWSARSDPNAQVGLPTEVEYIQTIRVHQLKTCGTLCVGPYVNPPTYTVRPALNTIATMAASRPGMLWRIGNEIERRDWNGGGQDEMTPAMYAQAFHEIQQVIKTADPTARVAIGSVIFGSTLRLQYLDLIWDSHLARYGYPIGDDIDVWIMHTFLLREILGDYGAEVPAGLDNSDGDSTTDYNPADGFLHGYPWGDPYILNKHHDLNEFKNSTINFRTWMASKGEQNKPLLNTEFGILYKNINGHSISPQEVKTFMSGAFDFLFNTTDPAIGYPLDENRLVQGWIWYSLEDIWWNGNLFDINTQNISEFGTHWQSYVTAPANPLASQPQRNLLVARLQATPNPAQAPSSGSTTVRLQAAVYNNGNTPTNTGDAVQVSFWDGDPNGSNSTQIGATQTLQDVPGCAHHYKSAQVDWIVGTGVYSWYAKIEPIANETKTTDNTAGSSLTVEQATAITLVSFTATPAPGGASLAWETGTEVDNAGFNLYRATAKDGPYTKINPALIPARGTATGGASYSYLDLAAADPDVTYYYTLEDVDLNGRTALHGPVDTASNPTASPPADGTIYLPVIVK